MDSTAATPRPSPSRLLIVADWEVDARAVVAAASEASRGTDHTIVGLLVPAWLHGLDWAGDPAGSFPCAQAKLDAISELARREGIRFEHATVGDPDPAAAIGDVVAGWPADEVRLVIRPPRLPFGHPLDLRHRAMRVTGLPVDQVALCRARPQRTRRRAPWIVAGHCQPTPQT